MVPYPLLLGVISLLWSMYMFIRGSSAFKEPCIQYCGSQLQCSLFLGFHLRSAVKYIYNGKFSDSKVEGVITVLLFVSRTSCRHHTSIRPGCNCKTVYSFPQIVGILSQFKTLRTWPGFAWSVCGIWCCGFILKLAVNTFSIVLFGHCVSVFSKAETVHSVIFSVLQMGTPRRLPSEREGVRVCYICSRCFF